MAIRRIHFHILCYEVTLGLFCIILIRGQRIPQFLVHPQHIGQLEEPAVVMYGAGFTYAHKTASAVYPSADCSDQRFIQPLIPAGPGRARVPCIDDDVQVFRDPVLPDILKAYE